MNELNMRPTTFLNALWLGLGLWAFASCALIEDKKEPGWEYAPQMYVSTPYEPYSQVTKNTINGNSDTKNIRCDARIRHFGFIARDKIGRNQISSDHTESGNQNG